MYNIEGANWILEQVGQLEGLRVCEFGNQHVWEHAMRRLEIPYPIARDWMEEEAVYEYVSLDMNGEDGALKVDLTKPLGDPALLSRFDLVTNIGTTEHCGKENKKQWQAFCTSVNICKPGGLILHQLPPAGQWLDHCDVWYKDGLGQILAERLDCELIVEERVNLPTLNPNVDYLCIALRRSGRRPTAVHNGIAPADFIGRLHR